MTSSCVPYRLRPLEAKPLEATPPNIFPSNLLQSASMSAHLTAQLGAQLGAQEPAGLAANRSASVGANRNAAAPGGWLRPSAARLGRSLRRALLLSPLLLAPLPLQAATNVASFNSLVATFRNYGFEVVADHPRCFQERNLFGLYLRGTRRIVVCPRGNQLDTLMHEGWHAVQARCRRGKPLLTNEFLRANLSRADLRDIDALYAAKSWHREAEARAMAAQQMPLYLAHLESSCGAPPPPAGVAGSPAAQPGASLPR